MKNTVLLIFCTLFIFSACQEKKISSVSAPLIQPSVKKITTSCTDLIMEGINNEFQNMKAGAEINWRYPFDDKIYAGDICFCKELSQPSRDYCLSKNARKHIRLNACYIIEDINEKNQCILDVNEIVKMLPPQ